MISGPQRTENMNIHEALWYVRTHPCQCSALCIFLDLTLEQGTHLLVSYSFQRINFQEDWKIITVFIGGNDLCDFCTNVVSLQALNSRLPREESVTPGGWSSPAGGGTWGLWPGINPETEESFTSRERFNRPGYEIDLDEGS